MPWVNAPGYLIVRQPKGTKSNCKKETREVVSAFRTSSDEYAHKVYRKHAALEPETPYDFSLYKEVALQNEAQEP